jgi:chromosome segregation ATPase
VNGVNGASPGASAGGKTGQVIEKLTAENDRLRRELRSERANKDEALLELQAMKSRIAYLEEKNSTISYQYDINESALARKERRIDDLRATIEEEARRRKRAEEQSEVMGKRLGETVATASKEVSEAKEARKMAELTCETLEREYSGLQARMQTLRRDWTELEKRIDEERDTHRRQLCQLEVILDQQRQQQEKSDKTVAEMTELITSYRETEENVKKLEIDMAQTVMEMRWVMRLHKTREEAGESHDTDDS